MGRPVIVAYVVNAFDEIVRPVRLPGWQNTSAGERAAKKALRKAQQGFHLRQDAELFERAYG